MQLLVRFFFKLKISVEDWANCNKANESHPKWNRWRPKRGDGRNAEYVIEFADWIGCGGGSASVFNE